MSEFFAIVCRDKADTKPTRMAGLKEHLAHLDEVFDRVALACPLHGEDGGFVRQHVDGDAIIFTGG